MWGGACVNNVFTAAIGNASCSLEPVQPAAVLCPSSGPCQLWASISAGSTYLLSDNNVTGAHINYLVEGLDQVGTLIDTGNVSSTPRLSDWGAARTGCNGVFWGPTRPRGPPPVPARLDGPAHPLRTVELRYLRAVTRDPVNFIPAGGGHAAGT